MNKSPVLSNASLFTSDQVELMISAMTGFESYLSQIHNLALPSTRITTTNLRWKLAEMAVDKSNYKYFAINASETLLLHAALVMYMYSLRGIRDSLQKQRMEDDCSALVNHFAAILPASQRHIR